MWQFKLFFHLYWRLHTLHDHGFSSSALKSISVDEVIESRLISRLIAFALFGEPAFVVPLLVPLIVLYQKNPNWLLNFLLLHSKWFHFRVNVMTNDQNCESIEKTEKKLPSWCFISVLCAACICMGCDGGAGASRGCGRSSAASWCHWWHNGRFYRCFDGFIAMMWGSNCAGKQCELAAPCTGWFECR